MWNRACPMCFAKVPRTLVLSRSYELNCPVCHASLEISRGSRVLASFVALLAAYFVAYLAESISDTAEWTLSIAAGVLTFALVSTLKLSFISDLVVRPEPSSANFPHQHTSFPHHHS